MFFVTTERTWRYAPLTPPNAVEVTPIDPETIYVTWRGVTPTSIEEALIGYKVKTFKTGCVSLVYINQTR